jgi:ribosomal protein L32
VASNLVCPRCGTPAAEHRYCPNCGQSLFDQSQLPTRRDWERQVLAAAREFASELPSRQRSSWKLPLVVLATAVLIGGAAAAALVLVDSSGDSSGESSKTTRRPVATESDLVKCTKGWNSERRILLSGYARGAKTAFVVLDAGGRCVVALPPAAARRSGFATLVQLDAGLWASYSNNAPKRRGRASPGKALTQAKEWEKMASETPNARVRENGTIALNGN